MWYSRLLIYYSRLYRLNRETEETMKVLYWQKIHVLVVNIILLVAAYHLLALDGQLEVPLVQARNIDLREVRLERFQRTPVAAG